MMTNSMSDIFQGRDLRNPQQLKLLHQRQLMHLMTNYRRLNLQWDVAQVHMRVTRQANPFGSLAYVTSYVVVQQPTNNLGSSLLIWASYLMLAPIRKCLCAMPPIWCMTAVFWGTTCTNLDCGQQPNSIHPSLVKIRSYWLSENLTAKVTQAQSPVGKLDEGFNMDDVSFVYKYSPAAHQERYWYCKETWNVKTLFLVFTLSSFTTTLRVASVCRWVGAIHANCRWPRQHAVTKAITRRLLVQLSHCQRFHFMATSN